MTRRSGLPHSGLPQKAESVGEAVFYHEVPTAGAPTGRGRWDFLVRREAVGGWMLRLEEESGALSLRSGGRRPRGRRGGARGASRLEGFFPSGGRARGCWGKGLKIRP